VVDFQEITSPKLYAFFPRPATYRDRPVLIKLYKQVPCYLLSLMSDKHYFPLVQMYYSPCLETVAAFASDQLSDFSHVIC